MENALIRDRLNFVTQFRASSSNIQKPNEENGRSCCQINARAQRFAFKRAGQTLYLRVYRVVLLPHGIIYYKLGIIKESNYKSEFEITRLSCFIRNNPVNILYRVSFPFYNYRFQFDTVKFEISRYYTYTTLYSNLQALHC